MAEALGRDRSDLMLEAIFQGEVKIPNTDPKLLRLNIEIKNELNQIARTCHANAKDGQTLDLLSVLVSLKEIKKRFDTHAL